MAVKVNLLGVKFDGFWGVNVFARDYFVFDDLLVLRNDVYIFFYCLSTLFAFIKDNICFF
jgi:hypothetical protein